MLVFDKLHNLEVQVMKKWSLRISQWSLANGHEKHDVKKTERILVQTSLFINVFLSETMPDLSQASLNWVRQVEPDLPEFQVEIIAYYSNGLVKIIKDTETAMVHENVIDSRRWYNLIIMIMSSWKTKSVVLFFSQAVLIYVVLKKENYLAIQS